MMGTAVRQMRAALVAAPDNALGRVVGMLDGLADRGAVDQLLADVRPRLRHLRPARPLRLARLLAMPLEGALVAPTAWKRSSAAEIPRSALVPLADAVRAAIGEPVEDVEAEAIGHNSTEVALITRLGARLWRLAASAPLPELPPGWTEAGLPREAAAPILALSRSLWRHGDALWAARLAGSSGPSEAILRSTFQPIAAEGPAALAVAALSVLREAAAPARVAAVAASLCPPVAPATERELAEVLADHAAELASAPTTDGLAESATALGQRLDDAEAQDAPAGRDARRRLVAQLRREGSECCRTRLVAALGTELLGPVAKATSCEVVEDHAVATLEDAARGLRRLEAAGRRLGQESAFDKAVAEAVPHLLALGAAPGGLGKVEVARLIEIIAGPGAALPLVGGQPGG